MCPARALTGRASRTGMSCPGEGVRAGEDRLAGPARCGRPCQSG